MTQRHGFLILPPFGLLSLSGAIDALLAANGLLERAAFDASVLTLDGAPVPGPAGRIVRVTSSLADWLQAPGALAGLFVVTDALPGDDDPASAPVTAALRQVAANGGLLGGIGSGAAWLAQAGLLRGHRCTLEAAYVAGLADRHADTVVSSHRYAIDRARLTCIGGTASLDLMIAWLGLRHGDGLARQLLQQFGLERLRAADEPRPTPGAGLGSGSSKLNEAVALMEANIGEPLSTEDIARLVGVSRRQLERLFKQHLDALPSRWYLHLRLKRARLLLQQTSQSILQIGLSCGFGSAPHFSNAYRQHFGRTPRDERSSRAAAWRDATVAVAPSEDPA